MPIEIKELVITAHVGASEHSQNHNAPPQNNQNNQPKLQGEANEDIIAQCVEQVMDIIRKKYER